MGSTFNPQILVDKLSKLNSSQQSIETLSHWCIFHMNKAKQVVETWDRQFHSAPREQRLAFLYLANDILQNSRRKGAEFVAEFWKVLPDALRDVMKNGDELAKGSALRLINIWEERKVFGSRGQILKEEFGKRQLDNGNRNRKLAEPKQQPPSNGNSLDKLVSGYDAVYSSQLDEDAIFNKCRNAISFVEKVDKDVEGGCQLVGVGDRVKEQHTVLRECIEQLGAVESARANFVSLLRETLQEQVYKLDQVHDLVQAAQMRSVQADSICRRLVVGGQIVSEQSRNGTPASQKLIHVTGGEQTTSSVTYTRQVHVPEEDPKSAAAAMAAKLTASSSSAQMLTYVLSSLASEGVIGKESSNEYPSEKRAKLDNEHPLPPPPHPHPPPPPPPPPYIPQSSQELNNEAAAPPPPPPPPPPPSSPPPLPPIPPPVHSYPYMPMISGSYTYSPTLQPPPPGPPFTPPPNGYQSYQPEGGGGGGGGFYGHPSSLSMSRQ